VAALDPLAEVRELADRQAWAGEAVLDALDVPADGSIPCFPIAVGATSNFSAFFGDTGRTFQTGIVLVNSSTAPTKTIGAADCFFDAQYL